jgi:hypothetical protein
MTGLRFFHLRAWLAAASIVSLHAGALPIRVPATVGNVLAQARKTWRKDAVAVMVELNRYPGGAETANTVYWLTVRMQSPSNRALRQIQVGGPNDGDIFDWPAPRNPAERAVEGGLPDFKLDLQDAIGVLRHAGLKDGFATVNLRMVGATGTAPIAAWTFLAQSAQALYPLAVDAQTGKIVPWQRAFDPPQWTDAKMKEIWDRVLNRNQPQNKPYDPYAREPGECVIEIAQVGHC